MNRENWLLSFFPFLFLHILYYEVITFIYKQKNIAAHATEELVTNAGIVLLQGEILKAQVNHANIDLVLSIIEYGKGD